MMNIRLKSFLIVLIFSCLIGRVIGQDTTRVLFIGNSLTYVNDLPNTFKAVSLAGGHYVETDQSVNGGYTLQMHFGDAQTIQKIQQGNWDYVVLQEQSQIPSMAVYITTEFYPYGAKLDSMIHIYSPAAKTVMFLTFAHRNGDESILAAGGYDTYWLMQGRLRESYLHLADSIHAIVAPVGCAWREVRMADSTIELYSDPVHPSVAGTYLAANVFYVTLFQQACLGNSYVAGLDATMAQFLQEKASSIVMDSLGIWNLGQPNGIFPVTQTDSEKLNSYITGSPGNYELGITGLKTGNYQLSLYNIKGQLLIHYNHTVLDRTQSIKLSLPEIRPGMYFIRISGNASSLLTRFIIP